MEKKYLKTSELCKLLPVTKQTIYHWRKEGMPFYGKEGAGNPKFYIESEVMNWLDHRDNADKVEDSIDKVEEVIKKVYPKLDN